MFEPILFIISRLMMADRKEIVIFAIYWTILKQQIVQLLIVLITTNPIIFFAVGAF